MINKRKQSLVVIELSSNVSQSPNFAFKSLSQYFGLGFLFLILIFFNVQFFNTIFKGYTPFTVITKYWLYSPCCTMHPCSLSYT